MEKGKLKVNGQKRKIIQKINRRGQSTPKTGSQQLLVGKNDTKNKFSTNKLVKGQFFSRIGQSLKIT